MALLATQAQEPFFQPAAIEVGLELLLDVVGQREWARIDESRERFVIWVLPEGTMVIKERGERVVPPAMSEKEKEMARTAQRCIMASLDHSRAAVITLTTENGSTPTVELPPAACQATP